MRIAVFGDVGVDRYLIVKARSLSAEAPIPVLDQVGEEVLPGMAGNVAANLQALRAEVDLILPPDGLPEKNRLITEEGVQVARFDVEDWCSPYTTQGIVEASLYKVDAVVVADYGKGAITDQFAQTLISLPLPLFVDTKRDPSCWLPGENVTLFPNLSEYRQFQQKYEWFPQVVLKQGSLGLSYLQFGQVLLTKPALASQVRCVNGAGDTTLAAFTVASLLGATIPQALGVASAAAALVVEAPFTQRVVSAEEVAYRMAEEFGSLEELCASS